MSLEKLTTNIEIEMTGETKHYLVSAKQGDKATRFINVKLLNNGVDYQLPEDAIARVNIKKPDGKYIYNSCDFSGSVVSIELTNQILAAAGTACCDVEIRTEDSTQVITSASFEIEIEMSQRNEEAIESSNEFTAFEKEIEDAKNGLIEVTDKAKDALKTQEQLNEVMEEADRISKQVLKSAEDSEKYATTAQESAEAAARSAEDAGKNEENALMAAEATSQCVLRAEDAANTASEAAETINNKVSEAVTQIDEKVTDTELEIGQYIEGAKLELQGYAETAEANASNAEQSAQSSSQSASEAQASAEAAARSAEEAKKAAGGDYVTHQEVGQPNGVAGLDENGKVPTEQLPEDIGGGIPTSEKGQPNGVATLGENGKVPTEQLPEIGEKVVVDGTTIVKDAKTGEISLADDITKSISDTQKSLSDHTDALVMSEEGVHGLRYYDEKLEAKDSKGTWHEIETGGGGGGIPLAEPTNISLENADESAIIKWTDPDDIVVSGSTIAKWDGTLIVRKVGSAPTSKTDGVLIVDSKMKNQYATNGYIDNGLTNGTEYFYGFFPYTDKNVYTNTKVSSISPSEIYPTAPSNVSAEKGNALATVSFTLADDTKTAKIVYGTHAPTSPSDGTAIETTTSPYTIEGLVNDTTYYIAVYAFNQKGRYTASDIVEVTPKSLEIVTFADGTWEQLQAMLEAHYNNEINISDYWAVDDRRSIPITAMSATGVGEQHHADTYEYVILGIEHDDLAEPINGHTKAAVTIGQVRCLTTTGATQTSGDAELGYMNSTNTNAGGWESCARRKWCNEVFFNALPDGLKQMIKTVKKYSGLGGGSSSGIQTTQDKVFLLSEIEIFGSRTYSVEGEGSQYPYFAISTSNRYKLPPWTSGYVSATWWERSPYSGHSRIFCNVNVNGNANNYGASGALALAPNMCL